MNETIYLNPTVCPTVCKYESFILDNIICKPFSEDLIFMSLLAFVGGGLIYLLIRHWFE